MRTINEIILHCSNTPCTEDWNAERIRTIHKHERHFDDIGYHYVIEYDGYLYFGRDIRLIGAHCKGHNQNSIGICLIGGYNGNPDCFNGCQFVTLVDLLRVLIRVYRLDIDDIHGHNEFSSKACPSFDVNFIKNQLKSPF